MAASMAEASVGDMCVPCTCFRVVFCITAMESQNIHLQESTNEVREEGRGLGVRVSQSLSSGVSGLQSHGTEKLQS